MIRKPPFARCRAAWFDQVEIRDQCSHVRQVFDSSDEVFVDRMVFVNDRRPAGIRVVHQDVYGISPRQGRPILWDGPRLGFGQRLDELSCVMNQIAPDIVEITEHRGKVGILLAQLIDQVSQGELGDLPVEFPNFAAQFPFPTRQPVQNRPQFLLQFLDVLFQTLPFLFRELLVSIPRDHLIILNGREDNTCRCLKHRKPFRLGTFLKFLEGFFRAVP